MASTSDSAQQTDQRNKSTETASQPASRPAAAFGGVNDTGQLLSIIGLVLVLYFPLGGLILAIFGYRELKRTEQPTILATASIWVNAIATVLGFIFIILFFSIFSVPFWIGR